MAWRSVAMGIEAARRGYQVVMTPNPFTYLNYTPRDPAAGPGHLNRHLSLETAHSFDPLPDELAPVEATRVLGSHACLWTEYVTSPAEVDELTYPRLCALAEASWSPPASDWQDFQRRLSGHEALLSKIR